jgi:hypothetical protein
MTTAAARIALAVHWRGFGSAPIIAAISVMEFTTFPLNPSPTRRKSFGECRQCFRISVLLVARRARK